jgi:hypothetical protein
VAWLIAVALLMALIAYIDNETNARELYGWFRFAFVSVILWFVFGPVWSVVFFRRAAPR